MGLRTAGHQGEPPTRRSREFAALAHAIRTRMPVRCGVDVDELTFRALRQKGHIDAAGVPPDDVVAAVNARLLRHRLIGGEPD